MIRWTARYLVNNWQLSVVSSFASAQPLTPQVFATPPAPLSALLSTGTLNGLGGSFRVPFEPPGSLNIDQLYRTDARISEVLPITERFKATLMFEAFNVFNHPFLSGPGPRNVTQFQTVKYNGGIAIAPYAGYGAPLQTQTPPDGTTAAVPRQRSVSSGNWGVIPV